MAMNFDEILNRCY